MMIATGLGTGYLPVSGTWASLLAAFLYLPFAPINTMTGGFIVLYLLLLSALTLLSILTAGLAEGWLVEKDPHKVVIDEIAGFFVAMTLLPATWPVIGAAFVMFRLFDIWKPYPIRGLQKIHGGLGITIDDILAGAYACVCVHAGYWIYSGHPSPLLGGSL